MPVSKRRCNYCREYFDTDSLFKVGSVWLCSERCQRSKFSRSDNGTKPKSACPDKSLVRRQVAKRDGPACLGCGRTGNMHLHRVVYGSQGGKYEPLNCVLLCGVCHNAPNHSNGRRSVHENKKLFQPILLAHLAGDSRARGRLRESLMVRERQSI